MAYVENDEKQDEKFQKWNPMREDYTNSNFNQYISGPGADLDPDFQPAQLSNQPRKHDTNQRNNQNRNGKAPVPYLLFKNIPKGMTTHALCVICSRHGRVEHVRNSSKNDYFFVDLASVADMEAVFRGLQNNSYGFQIVVGKQFRKDVGQLQPPVSNFPNDDELPIVESARKNKIDLENRKFQPSAKQHPRPHIKQKPIVSAESYAPKHSLLQRNDPQHHFLFEDDAHALERASLVRPKANSQQQQSKYKYNTGRAYIEMPKKTKAFVADKTNNSVGTYDASANKYTNTNEFSKQPALNSEKCVECGHLCDIVCARCGTFYCGIECQTKAWPKHRISCGKPENLQMKMLDTAEKANPQNSQKLMFQQTETKSGNEAKMPRSGNIVIITAISKTNVVFIRSKTYEENMMFFKIISAIQNEAKYFCKLQTTPTKGQIIVTSFQGNFNRAMVLNADDLNCINIIYIDYGNIDNKKLSDLYEAPESYVNLPRLAIPVILKEVPNAYMTEKVRQFMYSYLDDIDMQVKYTAEDFIAEKGVHCVELFDEATNQNFNKAVATLCNLVEPKEPNEVYFRDYLEIQLPPDGVNIELVVMDNSLFCTGCISCTTRECAIEIQKFQVELQRYGESLKDQNYAPRVDELCIVRYNVDGKWYRGRCLDLVGDGFPTIAFIDYGNIALVSIKDIRRYSPQFTYPIYTVDCEIEGLPECCDEKVVAKLEEIIPNGSTICCEQVQVYKDDNFLKIKLPEIIEDLKIAGLLEDEN